MEEKITLEKLEEQFSFFHKMYDVVRIVDPVCKKVLQIQAWKPMETNSVCHDFWQKDKICENCVSIRSHLEKKNFMKMEYSGDTVMLVTAIPVHTEERPVVLELLRDVTETMLMGRGFQKEGEKFHHVIDEMNDLIVKDPLTGLYNRRFLEERLPVEIIQSMINQAPLTVILLDIDRLKVANDQYGHVIGDAVIKELAKVLQLTASAKEHWAIRYGGDEFVLVLPDSTKAEAEVLMQNIVSSMRQLMIETKESFIPVDASYGIYTMLNEQLTAKELIAKADEAMYAHKKQKVTG